MATFVKFAVYKPMGFPLRIHYIDTAGNPIIGADGQPMIKLIDLTKTAATESDGFIDLKNVLYAQAIDGYEFTSNINTGNAEESKTLVGAETGEISGAPENRKYTIGSYTGYQLRFIKYDNGTFYAAMGNRTGNNRFAITGKPAVYLTYKKIAAVIYGAEWAGTSSPACVRTDAAANFTDPVPAYGDSTGSSPFDTIMPWSGMVKVEDAEAGTLVAIPKFYYKWTKTGSKLKLQITTDSFATRDGFCISPLHADRRDGKGERDVAYVARYKCSTKDWKSRSGDMPEGGVKLPEARTRIHNLGEGIWAKDFATWWTIGMLYLVEYANWNSEVMLKFWQRGGKGDIGGYNAQYVTGSTDSMNYHTGTIDKTVSKADPNNRTMVTESQYRNIEGIFGNVWEFIDGCVCYNNKAYICDNPAQRSENIDDYVQISGELPVLGSTGSAFIKSWAISENSEYPWALTPESLVDWKARGRNDNTSDRSSYICDSFYYDTNRKNMKNVMLVCVSLGRNSSPGWEAYGLFCLNFFEMDANWSDKDVGNRLIKLP